MDLNSQITEGVIEAVQTLYKEEVNKKSVQLQKTRREFSGDITLVVFPFLKISKKGPEDTGRDLGEYLRDNIDIVIDYNVIKGFLNLSIDTSYYIEFLGTSAVDKDYGFVSASDESELFMVEYSSPNTNKPLHLGHIRNNLLGWSVCEILKANGKRVVKTNIVNDRGIHICKSMLAWQKWGNGETPETTGKKGDHLVGDYYVKFDTEYKKQIGELVDQGQKEEEAAKNALLILEAQEMLRRWEARDPEIIQLWETMNG